MKIPAIHTKGLKNAFSPLVSRYLYQVHISNRKGMSLVNVYSKSFSTPIGVVKFRMACSIIRTVARAISLENV